MLPGKWQLVSESYYDSTLIDTVDASKNKIYLLINTDGSIVSQINNLTISYTWQMQNSTLYISNTHGVTVSMYTIQTITGNKLILKQRHVYIQNNAVGPGQPPGYYMDVWTRYVKL